MRLAIAGVIFGTVIALFAGKVTASLLFATTPWHFPTYLGMALAIVLVAAVSGYIPARRASRINPMEALRNN
jgi:ABC-type antimicrobial peptide transport system permease subunit